MIPEPKPGAEPGPTLRGRYLIERELGRGPSGVVFAGRDQLLEREVAIKLLAVPPTASADDWALAELALRRAATPLARVDHPGVVPLYDFGRADTRLFLIMPLVSGPSLRTALERGPLPLVTLADIGRQTAVALAYGHARELLHQDLEPSCILLSPEGSRLTVRLSDFGLDPWAGSRPVSPYLAPELLRGESAEPRSDLYALGAVLYEAAVGRPPFAGDPESMRAAIEREPPVRPGLLRTELPPALDDLIMALLAKQPARRPSSAREVAERLGPLADSLAAAVMTRLGRAVVVGLQSGGDPDPATGPVAEPRAPLLDAVGREGVVRAIELRLTAARAGTQQLLLLSGEPGSGKTTVLDQLALACQRCGIELLRTSATVDPRGGWRGPFGELLTAGLAQRPEAIERLADDADRLVALFPTLGRGRLGEHVRATEREPSWAGLEGVTGLGSPPPAGEAPASGSQSLLARVFAALLASGRPLCLAIDDAHLSPPTVAQVDLLFRRLPRAPLLIVLTYQRTALRPDHALARLRRRVAGHPRALIFELPPLPERAHAALLGQLLGHGRLEAGLAERLFREGGGHPQHARDLIRSAVESGILVERDGVWHLDAPRWPIPRALRANVEAQLRRLPAGALAAAQVGAVLAAGSEGFRVDDLVALLGRPADEVEQLLARARERGVIVARPDEPGRLRFTSELVRRIVHAGLSASARRKLHLHRAEQLRRLPFDERDAERNEQRILGHLLEAEAITDARPLVIGLAHEALDEGRPERALPSLVSLIELSDTLPVLDRGELLLLWAELEHARGDARAAVTALQRLAAILDHGEDAKLARFGERAAGLARQLDRRELADQLLGLRPRDRRATERQRRARLELAALRPASSARSMQIGDLLLMHGEHTAAREAYDAARRRAAAEGDLDEEARQLQRLARVASRLGHYESALSYCREGLERLAGVRSLERVGLWALAAAAHVVAGYPERAAAELEAGAAELATFADAPHEDRERVSAELERSRGDLARVNGRASAAIDAYERSLALTPSTERWTRSVLRYLLGRACALAGKAQRALRELERSAADKRSVGDREGLAAALLARVEVLRDLGHIDEAGEALTEARELAEALEHPRLFARVHAALAHDALLRGRVEIGAHEARRARDLAQLSGQHDDRLAAEALMAAAELARGELDEARRHAGAVLRGTEGRAPSRLIIAATLTLAEASEAVERPALLARARADCEQLGDPYGELDVSLVSLRLGLGDPHHAGDDYVALEQLSDRAEALGAQRHVGLCLVAQAEVLAPHDPRGALDHARLGEAQLRVLGARREADRATALIARLLRPDPML